MKKPVLLLIGLLIFILDRITKIILAGKDFFIFNYAENTGAIFGVLKESNSLLIALTLIAIIILFYFIFSLKSFSQKLALTLIASGLTANLFDRVFYGFVIDFIDLKFWPVFNLADASVFIGVIFLIFSLYKK